MAKHYPRATPRTNESIPKYIPHWQRAGIEPEKVNFTSGSSTILVSEGSTDNPRLPRPPIAHEMDFDNQNVPIDQWVDNNEYVDPALYEVSTTEKLLLQKAPKNNVRVQTHTPRVPPGYEAADFGFKPSEEEPRVSRRPLQKPKPKYFFSTLQDGEYCLFVGNDPLMSSFDKEEVSETVEALICGQHASFPGQEVSPESICVMKKCSVRSGVYIE